MPVYVTADLSGLSIARIASINHEEFSGINVRPKMTFHEISSLDSIGNIVNAGAEEMNIKHRLLIQFEVIGYSNANNYKQKPRMNLVRKN